MGLRSSIADAEQRVGSQLAFDRYEVVFIVGIRIARRWRRHSGLRKERREVDVLVRIPDRRVEPRKFERERLNVLGSVRGTEERRCKERRSGARITQTIGRLRFVDGDRVSLNDGIEE